MSGEPIIVEYETASGVRLHITPLALPTIRGLHQRAAAELPYPDPTPYEKPLENAVDDSIKLPAADNPEYQALTRIIAGERNELVNKRIILIACKYPDYSDFKAVLAAFKDRLKVLREVADLPADDTEATLYNCILSGKEDAAAVIQIAAQQRALTNGEIVEGVRLFRLKV